jgi:hypothetical protein
MELLRVSVVVPLPGGVRGGFREDMQKNFLTTDYTE